jgi:hypothetical protein
MILAALVLLAAPNLQTNVVNQSNPSTSIYCPVFMTKGEAIFGGPNVKPRGYNKTLQRHMCFTHIVRPLQHICILEGFDQGKCIKRSLNWIRKK